jgi:hypothetical protein
MAQQPFEIPYYQTITLTIGQCKVTIKEKTGKLIEIFNKLHTEKKTTINNIKITNTNVKIGDNCEIYITLDNFKYIKSIFYKISQEYEQAMEIENRKLVMMKYYNMLDDIIKKDIEETTFFSIFQTEEPCEVENHILILKSILTQNEKRKAAKFLFDQYESKVKELYPEINIMYGIQKDIETWSTDEFYSSITYLCQTFQIPKFKEIMYQENTYYHYL